MTSEKPTDSFVGVSQFLGTYGWAILIILIMIGGLYYFGGFNKNVCEKCEEIGGISEECITNCVCDATSHKCREKTVCEKCWEKKLCFDNLTILNISCQDLCPRFQTYDAPGRTFLLPYDNATGMECWGAWKWMTNNTVGSCWVGNKILSYDNKTNYDFKDEINASICYCREIKTLKEKKKK